MTIIDALEDPQVFGGLSVFRDLTTWRPWLTFLKALYGLPLSARELTHFCQHTGCSVYDPPPEGWREAVAIVGRQSGKTRIAAMVTAYEAVMMRSNHDLTEMYALMVAQDQRAAARTVFQYAVALFDHVPILRRCVVNQTTETLTLDSGAVLAAYPCRPAAIRGLRACVVVLDELAYFRSSDEIPQDLEMLRAARPTVATTADSSCCLRRRDSRGRCGTSIGRTMAVTMPPFSSGRRARPR